MVRALCDKCRTETDLNNLVPVIINIDTYGIDSLKIYYCAKCVKKFRDELRSN